MYEDIKELKGKTMASVVKVANEELIFTTDTGEVYRFYHEQDCCESVTIEDVVGNLEDLVGAPLAMAEVTTEDGEDGDYEYYTWTFYKFGTVKGYVTVRWYGTSNGYYSQHVNFERVK